MRKMLIAATALSLLSVPALAAPCRDAKGKFIRCPRPVASAARCKDARGRFAKCGTAGAHAVP